MTPTVYNCEQGTPEWFAARLGVATASRFADIMSKVKSGESAGRIKYRAQLVVEQLTNKATPSFSSAAMAQGTEREPLARDAYSAHTGNLVEQVGFMRHPDLACGASPDGLIDDDGCLEIKCPEQHTHLDNLLSTTIPSQYYWQVQGQMWISGRKWCDFVSFNPDFPEALQLKIVRVERNDTDVELLEKTCKEFLCTVDAAYYDLLDIVVAKDLSKTETLPTKTDFQPVNPNNYF